MPAVPEDRHDEIDRLVVVGASDPAEGGGKWAIAPLLVLLAPLALVFAYDLGGRVVSDDDRAVPALPWQEARVGHSEAWGDLIRIAGLPRFTELFPSEAERAKDVKTNERGFRDERPAGEPADIVVAGASFAAAGTTYADTLPAQIARQTGETARSLAWPGGGPVIAIEELLSEPPRAGEDTVVWCIVQRAVRWDLMRGLAGRIDASGKLKPPGKAAQLKKLARGSLRWHNKFEEHLKLTSPARQLGADIAHAVPPIYLDPGWTAGAKLSRWNDRPTLFLGQANRSVFKPLAERGGPKLIDLMAQAANALEARGQRCVIVLIPDKYALARPDVKPRLDEGMDVLEVSPTAEMARALQEAGVEAIDLLPAFAAVSQHPDTEPLFRLDDTHWSDAGIALAAKVIAEHLRAE